ncbi:unnamed protein product [Coffea canephora]|uniref:Isopenicillin N synthase-like Fe(2+) 2OG dioxygenase domain-containing protein n=1 Tax=Coffea canephora TaxID=49390 RepID=A0A068U1X9_COFCA|nr:unnamed protein product [Coffea canephora]
MCVIIYTCKGARPPHDAGLAPHRWGLRAKAQLGHSWVATCLGPEWGLCSLYESTLHRVTNNSPIYRVCVAYFYEPNYDAVIEPLDACVKQTGGTRRFEGAVYGKHLVSKVLTNFIY